MGWPRLRWLISLAPVVVLTGCGGAGQVGTTTVVSPRPVSALISAFSQLPTAGICAFSRGMRVTVYVGDGTPEPRCVRVRANQTVQVIKKAWRSGPPDRTVAVTWPPFGRRRLTSGSSIVFGQNFGSYLAPGDHILGISRYGGSGAEILLVQGTSSGATAECRGSALSIRLIHGGAAGPLAGGYLSFTNHGNQRCTLFGWPSVRGIRANGASYRGQHVRTTQFGPDVSGIPKVVLQRGGHADAVFVASTVPGPGRSRCGKNYRYLVVAAPGSRKSVLLSAWIPGLGGYLYGCSGIDVSMVVPAGSLYHG